MMEEKTLELKGWRTFATGLPRITVSDARISQVRYQPGTYDMYKVHDYQYWHSDERLPITELQLKEDGTWKTWMVDDPPHWYAMQEYADASSGRVLVAGLGLGLVMYHLSRNPTVRQVDVVERNSGVSAIVEPQLRARCPDLAFNVYHEDFNDYLDSFIHRDYDSVIVDLWVGHGSEWMHQVVNEEVIPMAKRIIRTFRPNHLVFHGFGMLWYGAWAEVLEP